MDEEHRALLVEELDRGYPDIIDLGALVAAVEIFGQRAEVRQAFDILCNLMTTVTNTGKIFIAEGFGHLAKRPQAKTLRGDICAQLRLLATDSNDEVRENALLALEKTECD